MTPKIKLQMSHINLQHKRIQKTKKKNNDTMKQIKTIDISQQNVPPPPLG